MANDKTIWEFLKSQGLNDYGAAGLMGNLYAESGLSPTNLQNTYNNKFGMTDDEYTADVDAGRYGNFVHDSAGYGSKRSAKPQPPSSNAPAPNSSAA